MGLRFHSSKKRILWLRVCLTLALITLSILAIGRTDGLGSQMAGVQARPLSATPMPTRVPLVNDAFPLPAETQQQEALIAATTGGPGQAPGYAHTSDFMIGTVTVAIILPESDGSIDPSTEGWTTSEINIVHQKVIEGLNWWEAQAQAVGVDVDFVVPDAYPQVVPTGYEPIAHPGGPPSPSWACGEENAWIEDVMRELGYDNHPPSDYILEVRDYDNDLRNAYGTNWAVTIFVVDGSNDGDGMFAETDCGGTVPPFAVPAYAYVGGPFLVMNNINDGYGTIFMNGVTSHEIGHIFGAADEAPSNHCQPVGQGPSCSYIWGYLGCPNENCDQSCALNETTCIMRWPQDNPPGTPVNTVCIHTQKHLGWWDTDGDGFPDPIDTTPDITLTPYQPDPTSDRTPTYTGSAEDIPFPSGNPAPTYWRPGYDDATINDVTVEYRVDGGSWHPAMATDGAFNSPYEDFTFTHLFCQNDTYLVEVRAINSVGNVSAIDSDTLTVSSTDTCKYVYLPVGMRNYGGGAPLSGPLPPATSGPLDSPLPTPVPVSPDPFDSPLPYPWTFGGQVRREDTGQGLVGAVVRLYRDVSGWWQLENSATTTTNGQFSLDYSSVELDCFRFAIEESDPAGCVSTGATPGTGFTYINSNLLWSTDCLVPGTYAGHYFDDALLTIGEVGQLNDALTHAVQTVMLSRSYLNPVVFAQPLSRDGGDTAVVRITDVQADRFTLYVHEAPNRDGPHTTEAVSYVEGDTTYDTETGHMTEVVSYLALEGDGTLTGRERRQ